MRQERAKQLYQQEALQGNHKAKDRFKILILLAINQGIPKEEMSVHGFRAMARTLCHERLYIKPEVIEHQLGHKVPDALGQAYNRTRFIDDRIQLMQQWADYLDQLKQG